MYSPVPLHQANRFAHNSNFALQISFTNCMLDYRGGGCQNAQKQIIIKAHLVIYFISVNIHSNDIYIPYVVMIHLSEQVELNGR